MDPLAEAPTPSEATAPGAGPQALPPTAIRFGPLASILIAAGIGAGLLVALEATGRSLPGHWGAALFLVVIAQQDCERRKIPNWATGTGLLGALVYHAVLAGGAGALAATLGAAVAFAIGVGPYAMRVLGAGDVKALMVVGALFGLPVLISVLFFTMLIGGAIGLVLVVRQGELQRLAVRWGRILANRLPGRRDKLEVPPASPTVSAALPLGPAIGLAVIAHVLTAGGTL